MSLPKAAIERIIRGAGAERVSGDAVEELKDAVEDLAEEVASDSSKFADYADRNTVKKEDVDMAVQH